MSNALDHVRNNCGIAGEEVAGLVDALERQLATVTAERDELLEALKLIVSADDRGFGISYVKGCAQSALAKLNDGKGE